MEHKTVFISTSFYVGVAQVLAITAEADFYI